MRLLNNEEHEKLWHLCNRVVVEAAGARAAMLCDARDGNVLISIGETNQSGAPSGVTTLGPHERVVQGSLGNVYGVDLPNDFMLAVLHDESALEAVRAVVSRVTSEFAEMLTPPKEELVAQPPRHDHGAASAKKKPVRRKKPAAKKAAAKKKAPARKRAGAPKKKAAKKKR